MKFNIVFSCISLDNMAGGLEKNLVSIANALAEKNYNVNIITFDNLNAKSFFKINKKINWYKINIGTPHKEISTIKRILIIFKIRKFLKQIIYKNKVKYNSLICFHHGILLRYIFAKFLLPYKLICSERNSLKFYNYTKQKKNNLNFLSLYLTDNIIVQFKEYISDYPISIRKKITAIPNQLEKFFYNSTKKNNNKKIILNIGRLEKQKRQLELIEAFDKSLKKHKNLELLIVGNGNYYKKLKNKINETNLNKFIKIINTKKDIKKIYKLADIYCLTSEWEGFPNVLGEALLLGLPSIAPKSCEGANKLIKNKINGLLFNDDKNKFVNSLSSSINFLIENPNKRKQLSKNAKLSMNFYNSNSIIDQWEDIIIKTMFKV